MVDFVIAGTFKSASSTLAFELSRHPEISIPNPKDPYFYLASLDPILTGPPVFMRRHRAGAVLDRECFEGIFPDEDRVALRGDATPLYLYCHEYAIPAIQKDNPHTKIIIILRNPADRAFSNFNHNLKDGFENRDFSACIKNWEKSEKYPLHPFFHYVRAGFYDEQVSAYQAAFEHVKVITYEQVVNDVHVVLNQIANFLGVEPNFKQGHNTIQLNKSGSLRLPALHRFILHENPIKSALRPIYRSLLRNPHTRKRLAEQVKNLNIESQEMLQIDRTKLNDLYAYDIASVSERVDIDLSTRWRL